MTEPCDIPGCNCQEILAAAFDPIWEAYRRAVDGPRWTFVQDEEGVVFMATSMEVTFTLAKPERLVQQDLERMREAWKGNPDH